MLPFDYIASDINLAVGPAVVYSFLFVYTFWVYTMTYYATPFRDLLLYAVGSISGIVNASLMLASINQTGTEDGYKQSLAAFVFYFVTVCSIWLVGIREAHRVIRNHSKNIRHQLICQHLVNISYWVSISIVGFACAVAAVHYSWIPRSYSGESITNEVLGHRFFITVMALRWLLVIIYFVIFRYSLSLLNRKGKDVLILFGVLNTVATIVDTIYMFTSFLFFGSLAAGFILFFFTDVLMVIPLLITTLTWEHDMYNRLQSDQTV